jgi:glucose 1-dehydrogenase
MRGSVVLLTGACGDIGREIALAFARTGASLVLNDLLESKEAASLIQAVRAAGGDAIYFSADVSHRGAVDDMVKAATDEFGPLDIHIANAAVVEVSPFLDLDSASWRKHLDVNLTGSFEIGQSAARAMVNSGRTGKIIFIGSWVQDVPWTGIAPYCVSKASLKLLAKCMALELGSHGIRVNLVAPGFVDAGLSGRFFEQDQKLKAESIKLVPLGYIASAADVASAVMLLCSESADYMTGSTLLVDGGNSLFYRRGDS